MGGREGAGGAERKENLDQTVKEFSVPNKYVQLLSQDQWLSDQCRSETKFPWSIAK